MLVCQWRGQQINDCVATNHEKDDDRKMVDLFYFQLVPAVISYAALPTLLNKTLQLVF